MPGPFDMGANALLGIGQNTVRPIDAGDRISQFASTQNALLGNQVQQAEFDARKARGAAYAHHYNRLTGQYDMPAVQQEMGSTAAGQYGLPEAVTTVRNQQTQQIANDTNQLGLNQRHAGILAGILAPYANKEGLTKQDLAPAYGSAIAHGLIDIDRANQSYASLPAGGDALRQQVRGLYSAAAPNHGYDDAYGSMTMVDDGGTLKFVNVRSPASGQGGQAVGASIQKQNTPEFNKHLVDIIDGEGKHRLKTQESIINGRQPTVPPEVMGNGRYQGAQPTAQDPEGYQAAPPAGQVEAQRAAAEVAGKAAGDQFGDAGKLSAGFGDRMYRSQKALQLLQDISPASGGVGEARNRIVNAAVSLGMITPSDKAASYDEANKYLTQLAASQPGAAHSDAQLATALAGNPSTHINNLAAQDALKANIALDRRANAAYLAFHQKYPGTQAQVHADEWPAFQTDYTTQRDARAFMFDVMSREQRARVWSGMDEKQRNAFRSELRNAMATGLVQAPSQ